MQAYNAHIAVGEENQIIVNGFRVYQKYRRPRQQRRDGKPPLFVFYRGSIDVNQLLDNARRSGTMDHAAASRRDDTADGA